MGRAPCCDKAHVKKGPWSPEEDAKLKDFIEKFGTGGNWIALPQKAGLKRCGKSCRLRWLNYLRPNIKHGEFTEDEDRVICSLYNTIGSRWSIIAAQLPGRTDNDIKNYWNTKLKKKLLGLSSQNPNRKPHQSQLDQLHFQQFHFPSLQSTSHFHDQYISNPLFHSSPNISSSSSYQQFVDIKPSYENTSNMIMFGSEKSSCTSSDQNIASFDNYLYSRNNNEEKQNNLIIKGEENGILWGSEAPLEYNYEEIKQLLSSNYNWSNGMTPTNSNFALESPVGGYQEGKVMTYQF
ncbi:hypothetical protein LUZ60_016170 [Juncus effusus]|nr:hypothetical protein LUZ60_016170 [Juncus effusus]